MSIINKILAVIFIILLTTIGLEVGYLFSHKKISNIDSISKNILSSTAIQFMKRVKPNNEQKIYLTIEQSGFIKKVEDKTGKPFFYIIDGGGNVIIDLPINEKVIFHSLSQNGNKKEISYQDIKEGSQIILKREDNLLNPKEIIAEILIYEK